MTSKLFGRAIYSNDSAPYFQEDFSQVLDSHIEYLRKAGNPRVEAIDRRFLGQFRGDFYAVLSHLRVHPKYHRITMLLNGFTNPIEFNGQLDTVFIPDTDEIDGILAVYNTSRNKIVRQEGQ